MRGMHTFVLWNNIHCSLLSLTPTRYWLLCRRWCSCLRGGGLIVQLWCMREFLQSNPSHVWKLKKKEDRQRGLGVQMWEVGFWLHWQLWGTRGLSEQEMTWPSLWEANPAWHQPPLLGASRVTLSAHRGQRSDSSPVGGRENQNMLWCFPFDRIKTFQRWLSFRRVKIQGWIESNSIEWSWFYCHCIAGNLIQSSHHAIIIFHTDTVIQKHKTVHADA